MNNIGTDNLKYATERRVLVVPGTTEVGLEIHRSLRDLRGIMVFGAGTDLDFGHDVGYTGYEFLPKSGDPSFLKRLHDLCQLWSIDVVFPAHDQIIFDLRAENQIGRSMIVGHPSETIRILRSKHLTYDLLNGLGVTPKVFRSIPESKDFPIFLKPTEGQGSVGAELVSNRNKLKTIVDLSGYAEQDFMAKYVVSEYLPGLEVTVDCFSTIERGLQFCAARSRSSIRNGISVYSECLVSDELNKIGEKINDRVTLDGAWFFQAKLDSKGKFRVLEVAPRIAGSSGIRRGQGVNLSHLNLLKTFKQPTTILKQIGPTRSRRLLSDFFLDIPPFSRVCVDYDDTLIRNGLVDAELVGFLFAAKSLGKSIELLTRHDGNVHEEIQRRGLTPIFDSVVHIKDGALKSTHINSIGGVLFIDDSFAERLDVANVTGALAVDPSAIRGLWGALNER